MTTVPPPPPSFGSAPYQYNQAWMSTVLAQIARRLGLLSGPYTVQPQLLLQSPDGTVFQVTVDDSGALSTMIAQRGDIAPPV